MFWTVIGSAGALPFLIADNPSVSVTDAFFESFSALPTTGATLQLLASMIHLKATHFTPPAMVCGMGIIVLAVAILPVLGIGGMQLYRAEIPGPVKTAR
ncbi:hypothetical protein O9929_21565 [Vibrio lentus]|nr:hypothetical protein [Vibrio lentus]